MGRHHDILFQGWQTKCQNDWVVPGNFSTRYLSSKETEENNDGFVLFSEYWRKCQCSLKIGDVMFSNSKKDNLKFCHKSLITLVKFEYVVIWKMEFLWRMAYIRGTTD